MEYNSVTGKYEYVVSGLKAGASYTVTESGYEVADYRCEKTEPASPIQIQAGQTATADFTNKYTWNPTGKLTISKQLTGMNASMGTDATFLFEIKATSGEYKDRVWYRAITFTAAGTGTAEIEGLPVGTYQVTELKSAGYVLDAATPQVQDGTITVTGGTDTVSYKNNPTTNKDPGDQDYVLNNFEYIEGRGWVFTQG